MSATGTPLAAEMAQEQYTPELLEERFGYFLAQFGADAEGTTPLYVQCLADMKTRDLSTLYVHLAHVFQWDPSMGSYIEEYYNRLEPTLRKALHAFIKDNHPGMVDGSDGNAREHYVAFHGQHPQRMRDLRTQKLGRLSCFMGTVTRSSEVRPELLFGAFKCGQCSAVKRGVPQQFKYSPPAICDNQTCNNRWGLAFVGAWACMHGQRSMQHACVLFPPYGPHAAPPHRHSLCMHAAATATQPCPLQHCRPGRPGTYDAKSMWRRSPCVRCGVSVPPAAAQGPLDAGARGVGVLRLAAA